MKASELIFLLKYNLGSLDLGDGIRLEPSARVQRKPNPRYVQYNRLRVQGLDIHYELDRIGSEDAIEVRLDLEGGAMPDAIREVAVANRLACRGGNIRGSKVRCAGRPQDEVLMDLKKGLRNLFNILDKHVQDLRTGCQCPAKPKTEPRQTSTKDMKDVERDVEPERMAHGAPCSENDDWVTGPLPSIENRKEYWKKYFEYWDQFVQDWFDKKAKPRHRISGAFRGLVRKLDFNELPEPYQLALHKGTGDFANRKFKAVWLNLNPGKRRDKEDSQAFEDREERKFYTNLGEPIGDLIRAYAKAGSFSGYQKENSCLINRKVPGGSTFYADRKHCHPIGEI